jgi:adenylate cyclase
MTDKSSQSSVIDEMWHSYLTTGEFAKERRQRHFFRLLPGTPRCKNCYAPFHGVGSPVVRLFWGKHPSNMNPQLCNVCEVFAREHRGGAEIELSMLFADVRGSTSLAESMNPTEFSKLINRFYSTATQVMVNSDALIDKIIGDQVAGMYVPGFAGPEHARRAIEAAQEILRATGHRDHEEPWIPLGVGVHTGTAYVGALRSEEGVTDITVLGDAANTTARLSTSAGVGEILVSDSAYSFAGVKLGEAEKQSLELKGKSEPIDVWVIPSGRK